MDEQQIKEGSVPPHLTSPARGEGLAEEIVPPHSASPTRGEGIVGKRYPQVTTRIEKDEAEAFAEVLGAPVEAAPTPTFASTYVLYPTFRQLIEDAEAAVDMALLVHGEQEFEWTRQPHIGETLTVEGVVEQDVVRRGMRFVTLAATASGANGEEVCRSRMMCLIRKPQ